MSMRGLGAGMFGAGVLVLAIAVRAFAGAMVNTWSPTLTVVVVMFAGVSTIIVSVGVGAGVRLALSDRRDASRPVVITPPAPMPHALDTLRDVERLSRIDERYHRMGSREGGTVPAFEAGQYVEWNT